MADIEEVMLQVEKGLEQMDEAPEQRVIFPRATEGLHTAQRELNALWQINPVPPADAGGRALGPAVSFAKRAMRRLLRWHTLPLVHQIQTFHAAVVSFANSLMLHVRAIEQNQAALQAKSQQLEYRFDDLKRRIQLLTELDVERRLDRLERSARRAHVIRREAATGLGPDPGLAGIDYVAFEDRHRGSEELIKSRQDRFLTYFRGAKGVVDLGCGRGEFLELLRDAHVEAYGVDIDALMVEHAASKQLKVFEGDAVAHLRSCPEKSLGGAFLGQLVEHMPLPELVELVDLLHDRLKPDCYVVMETVNPLCLSVFSRAFYLDPTHQRPIHPEFLRFQLESAGFRDINVLYLSPVAEEERLELLDGVEAASQRAQLLNRNLSKLNDLLFAYQDYAIVARK